MLKVAIVCGAGIVSGKEIMALELAKGLRDKGCDVEVVTSFWGNGELRRRLEEERLPAHIMRLGFISATLNLECLRMTAHQMLFWPTLLRSYQRFLKSVRPAKVIHTNWHHVLLLWPLLRPHRDIYWAHEVFADKPQYRRFFSTLTKRIDCFVAVSKAASQSLLKLEVPSNKVVVVYNGISDPVADWVSKSESVAPIIGIVGQIGAWKGHEDLLAAMQLLIKNYPATKLHIFGKGSPDYEALLHRMAVKLKIDDKVVWRGYVSDRDTIFRELAILVVPSRFEEPFGLTAIEAAFFSIPVIASRSGGLLEIVEDGITGLFFECGKIEQLARHLIGLISDTDLRQRMGKVARERAISTFSRDRFVRQFREILELKSPNVAATNSVE